MSQSALSREGRLRALEEATAIGDTSEDARNELWVIHQTESEEGRVLLGKVEVETSVEGVAIFLQDRRVREILKDTGAIRLRIEVQQFNGIRIESVRRQDVEPAASKGKRGSAGRACTEWIAHKASGCGRSSRNGIDSSGRDCSRSSRIENRPDRNRTAQSVVSSGARLAADQISEIREV